MRAAALPAPASLDLYAALAGLASEYVTGRISDADYVTTAMGYGLSRDEAICRVMMLDDGGRARRVAYRRARAEALRAVRIARYYKQGLDLPVGMDGLSFWQMELVRLRRGYHGEGR